MLAALHSEPGRLTSVPANMVEPFLRQAPVALLQPLGFGADLIERLELFGLKAVGHLLYLSERHLTAQFGREGNRLFSFLHPPADEPPIPHYDPRVAEATFDFDWPVFEPHELQPALRLLLERLFSRLRGHNIRHLEVRLKGRQDHNRVASRILIDPAHQFPTLHRAAEALLHQAMTQQMSNANAVHRAAVSRKTTVPSGRAVQSLTLILSGITQRSPEQIQLFAKKPDLHHIAKAADQKFPGKLVRPIQTHADPFFPEEEYRFEPVAR